MFLLVFKHFVWFLMQNIRKNCNGGVSGRREKSQPTQGLLEGSWSPSPALGLLTGAPSLLHTQKGPSLPTCRWHPRGPAEAQGLSKAFSHGPFWPSAPRLPPSPSLYGACRCVWGPGGATTMRRRVSDSGSSACRTRSWSAGASAPSPQSRVASVPGEGDSCCP